MKINEGGWRDIMHKTRQKYITISKGKEMLSDMKERREDAVIVANNTDC